MNGLSDSTESGNGNAVSDAALNAALAAAQGEFPPIPRDKTVTVRTRDRGSYSFSYAPLDAILGACRPVLAKHGLAITQLLDAGALTTELRHKDGGVISASFAFPNIPESPQQLGSLLTYLRRYAIVALLGVAAEEDDDAGQAADVKPAAHTRPRKELTGPLAPKTPPADTPVKPSQAAKLNVLVGKLRGPGHITTEQLWLSIALERNMDMELLIQLLEGRDRENVLHWAPLRDSLTVQEASGLIDRLTRFEQNLAGANAGQRQTDEIPY